MFGGIRIGQLAGIPFYINPSWFLVFALVTLQFATGQLPAFVGGQQGWVYWVLAAVIALLFFASVIAHELGHSLVSRAYGIPVRSITLHMFGGVAQLGREVRRAREEFWIALAGPAVSLLLAVLFGVCGLLLEDAMYTLGRSLLLLAILNVSVVVFNMVPGFPLDGGRVLRSIVWGITGDYRKASKIAAVGGRLVGSLFILLGVYLAVSEGDLGNLWLALIGWFLINMARFSYAQAVIQDILRKTPVSQTMTRPITVPADLTVDELFAGYIRTTGRQFYFAEAGGRTVGLVGPGAVAQVPWTEWRHTTLRGIMTRRESLPVVDAGVSAASALNRMEDLKVDYLAAVESGYLVGLVTREHLVSTITRRKVAR